MRTKYVADVVIFELRNYGHRTKKRKTNDKVLENHQRHPLDIHCPSLKKGGKEANSESYTYSSSIVESSNAALFAADVRNNQAKFS